MDSVVNNILSSWDSLAQATSSTPPGSLPATQSPTASTQSQQSKKKPTSDGMSKSTSNSSLWSSLKDSKKDKTERRKSSDSINKKSTASSFFDDLFYSSSKDKGPSSTSSSASYTNQLTDKFIERLITMALPTTTTSDESELNNILARKEAQKSRPQLSINTMSKNSVLLLTRLSVPFEMLDQIVEIFNWSDTIYTLNYLNLVTLIILKPILILSLPLFYICFEIIIPAYMKRHPSDKSTVFQNNNPIPNEGPSLNKIELPRPVPEISREFYLNVTDLQNRMTLYIVGYDIVTDLTIKYLYFKDENLTISIFFILLISGILVNLYGSLVLTIFLPILKVFAIVVVWTISILFHPNHRDYLLNKLYSEETRLKLLSLTNKLELKLNSELNSKEFKQLKELEIFELQSLNNETRNWQLVCFTNEPFPLNCHKRLNNISIDGSPNLLGIKPPKGWKFVDVEDSKKSVEGWILDLQPDIWVRENYLNDLIDIDDDEKWCYDYQNKFNYNGLGLGVNTSNKHQSHIILPSSSTSPKKDGKVRGDFRRRRWTRYCIRSIWEDENDDNDSNDNDKKTNDNSSNDSNNGTNQGHKRNKSSESSNFSLNPISSTEEAIDL